MGIEIRAVAKYIRGSPEKTKRVVNMVRGKNVNEALSLLKFSTRGAADPVARVIASAAANAEQNFGLARDELFVAQIFADEGPTLKRGRFGARGRFKPILKRSSHITVVLESLAEAAQ
jgi:large subunit ribosomal protein L22